jgi:lipid II:glycine glycyltransferase (peptidoglycan interpeptide bridge formation enzyme)
MKLIEIKDKKQLNDFVGAQTHAELLQSWEWSEFQEQTGNKIFRLGLEEDGKIIAAATLMKKSLPLGMNYFYCPRGPISKCEVRSAKCEVLEFLFGKIKKIAREEKVIFLRIEPFVIARSASDEAIPQFGDKTTGLPRSFQSLAMTRTLDTQVSKTIILNLTKSEEELLAAMHQKTRYNIRLAEKKGVKIREAGCVDFEKFWDLMSATVNRDSFRLHDKEYYKKMLEVENIKLFFAEYQNNILCAGIFSFFGDTAIYLHGASSNENRELMAPYLLQWELIKKAKSLGCKYYDFFGIDEKKWPGVTRFKKGFGGEELNYPGTFDVIFNKNKYGVYKFLRKARRLFKI